MKTQKLFSLLLLSAGMALTGCGQVTPVGTVSKTITGSSGNSGNGWVDNSSGSGSNNNSGDTDQNLMDPETYSFEVTGPGGAEESYSTPTIRTDTTLKVKVVAGGAGIVRLPSQQYSGYSAQYSCVKYTVTIVMNGIDSQSVTTAPLSVIPGGCNDLVTGAVTADQTSQIIDFSRRLSPGQNGDIKIKVSRVNTNYWCILKVSEDRTLLQRYGYIPPQMQKLPYSTSYYCPIRPHYKNHTANGDLMIETNDTRPLQ